MNVLLLKNVCRYILFHMSKYVPWTQEMCNDEMRAEALVKYLLPLAFVPDQNKTQKMCEKAVEKGSYNLKFVPESLRPKRCVKKPLKIIQKT